MADGAAEIIEEKEMMFVSYFSEDENREIDAEKESEDDKREIDAVEVDPEPDPEPELYDSDDQYSPEQLALWDSYFEQLEDSDGFDIDFFPRDCPWVSVVPLRNFATDPSSVALYKDFASKAIGKFNSENHEDYEVVEVKTVNWMLVAGDIYFITFVARKMSADAKDDESALKIFQARVWEPIRPEPVLVQFCRLKCLT